MRRVIHIGLPILAVLVLGIVAVPFLRREPAPQLSPGLAQRVALRYIGYALFQYVADSGRSRMYPDDLQRLVDVGLLDPSHLATLRETANGAGDGAGILFLVAGQRANLGSEHVVLIVRHPVRPGSYHVLFDLNEPQIWPQEAVDRYLVGGLSDPAVRAAMAFNKRPAMPGIPECAASTSPTATSEK
jgi:hypothetical protein